MYFYFLQKLWVGCKKKENIYFPIFYRHRYKLQLYPKLYNGHRHFVKSVAVAVFSSPPSDAAFRGKYESSLLQY